MQFKIPQNVQLEDKIVGPLTLKQLAILGGGGGVAYAIYVSLSKTYIWVVWLPPTVIISLVTLALTFLKINGIPFSKWVFLIVEFLFIPRKRVFIMGAGDHYEASIFAKKEEKKKSEHELTKAEKDMDKIKKLNEISKILDSYGKPKTT